MTQVSLSFLYGVLRSTLAVYIVLVALHFVLEVFFAHRAYRRSKQGFADPARLPSVDIVVPCYNEDAEHLTACFDALLDQDYEGELHVYVVDDGSPNRDQVRHVYDRYGALHGWHVLLPAANRGKRHAQDAALRPCRAKSSSRSTPTRVAPDGVPNRVTPSSTQHRCGHRRRRVTNRRKISHPPDRDALLGRLQPGASRPGVVPIRPLLFRAPSPPTGALT